MSGQFSHSVRFANNIKCGTYLCGLSCSCMNYAIVHKYNRSIYCSSAVWEIRITWIQIWKIKEKWLLLLTRNYIIKNNFKILYIENRVKKLCAFLVAQIFLNLVFLPCFQCKHEHYIKNAHIVTEYSKYVITLIRRLCIFEVH